ncbi:tRNA synthetases class I (M)-domain-containing protein [Pterulicium gracile]|uniref:Probable methionine--tRNA ligase, mitochondrial n=1 Tax=Pterulicium gracile TaxID=1884261 RepID=A0A5C3R1J8_9AGAR|nr:tRNA synthetases class I (M)-domain-containing protein [Pterula gracilis]
MLWGSVALLRLQSQPTGISRLIRALPRCLSHAPTTETKPYYITTPIFYPNADPHIGHLYSIVTADIFARFNRLIRPQPDVHFLTGTDEHGLKIQKAAQDRGIEPGHFCDLLSERFRLLAAQANSSHTSFMRTTSSEHHQAVQHMWNSLVNKGLIYKDSYAGWYSVSDECFYAEKQVIHIPETSNLPASVVSAETGSLVEWAEEENYMFRLSAFRESLLDHYTSRKTIIFPPQHHDQVVALLAESAEVPLDDISVSRPRSRLAWGVPVPGDPEHTIYVWIDALMVYLSGVGYPWTAGAHNAAWPANVQVIGKDILRFHALYLPAMLQAVGLPLAQSILCHAHWTVNGRKMSKSVGNVVDPFECMKTYGVDVVRYYFARVGGKFRDDVNWADREVSKYRDEISSFLGNFLMRMTSTKIQKRCASAAPRTLEEVYAALPADSFYSEVIALQKNLSIRVAHQMEAYEVADALESIVNLLKQSNMAVTEGAPWSAKPEDAQTCYTISMETLRLAGLCLQPFIPDTSARLLHALGVGEHERSWEYAEIGKGTIRDVKAVRLFEFEK